VGHAVGFEGYPLDEVGEDFVADAEGFGEGLFDVAEAEEDEAYCFREGRAGQPGRRVGGRGRGRIATYSR